MAPVVRLRVGLLSTSFLATTKPLSEIADLAGLLHQLIGKMGQSVGRIHG